MGLYAAGQVVFLPFPFSDLTQSKLRPGLLLAHVRRGDWIACQITSNPLAAPRAITLSSADFAHGGLPRLTYICPGKLFTANESLITAPAGRVSATLLRRVRDAVTAIVSETPEHPAILTQ